MYNLIEQRDKLNFGLGAENEYSDFRIKSSESSIQDKYDVLIFTDSKGSVVDFISDAKIADRKADKNNCWIDFLAKHFENKGISYLLIARPKILTVFFTLINFLRLNNISFKYLITNMGFVDLTPKKIDNMEDIMQQSPFENSNSVFSYKELSKYELRSGEVQSLYTFEYGNIYKEMGKIIAENFTYSMLIGSMEFSPEIKIPRVRPIEFYNQLKATNHLIFNITQQSENLHYLQPLKYQYHYLPKLSQDGVHYTRKGHKIIFELIKPYINVYF